MSRIYSKFIFLRLFLRNELKNILYSFIITDELKYGIPEILDIFSR